jgi:hypothetical protein
MSKIQIVKTVARAITDLCQQDRFTRINVGTEPEVFYFHRDDNSYFCEFTCSFSGRKSYSAFCHIYIVYKELSHIMYALLKGTKYEEGYNISNYSSRFVGVGIGSSKPIKDNGLLYIDSVNNADNYADELYRKIREAEQSFILPAANIENTIAGFMKKIYYFWPGGMQCFIEHLVVYGINTNDAKIVNYAFEKIEEVLPKISEDKRPVCFINTVKEKLAEQHAELWHPT